MSVRVWNVVSLGTWRPLKFAERRGTALQRCTETSLDGRRRGCGWLRACGRRGPARVGAAGVGGDGQRPRPGGVQEEPAPPAAGRRQQTVILLGAEVGEAGLRVPLGDVADAQVPCGGRVRPVGARAGAAGAQVQCLGLWFVRTLLCVHCNALVVRVRRVGSAGQRISGRRAQHAVAVRARRSRQPLGAALGAAPLGSLLLPCKKVVFIFAFGYW